MPDTTETTAAAETQATSDATDKNTEAVTTGADTQTAKTEAQPDKTFTQADVDRIVQNRLKAAVKAELKKLTDDPEKPNADDLQRQLSERDEKIRAYEAREAVDIYINDGRNKLNIRPENARGIKELVIPRLEYDENGKPTNIKDAFESAKVIAPALFANTPSSINAGEGRNGAVVGNDMNAMIRRAAGIG